MLPLWKCNLSQKQKMPKNGIRLSTFLLSYQILKHKFHFYFQLHSTFKTEAGMEIN